MRILAGAAMVFSSMVSVPAMAQSGHGGHDPATHGHGMPPAHEAAHGRTFPDPSSAAAPHGVAVEGCWIRALPNRLPAAGYFVMRNASADEAVLVGAQAAGFGRVMLHTHQTVNGMSVMVHVDAVKVPAGGSFEFAPGGHHLMLEKPQADLVVGSRLPVTLWFEGGRALTVECHVRGPSATK